MYFDLSLLHSVECVAGTHGGCRNKASVGGGYERAGCACEALRFYFNPSCVPWLNARTLDHAPQCSAVIGSFHAAIFTFLLKAISLHR